MKKIDLSPKKTSSSTKQHRYIFFLISIFMPCAFYGSDAQQEAYDTALLLYHLKYNQKKYYLRPILEPILEVNEDALRSNQESPELIIIGDDEEPIQKVKKINCCCYIL